MDVPGVGTFERDSFGALVSEARPISAFGNRRCSFQLDGYEDDPHPDDFHQAMRNVLAAAESLLLDATPYVHLYCREMLFLWGDDAPRLQGFGRSSNERGREST